MQRIIIIVEDKEFGDPIARSGKIRGKRSIPSALFYRKEIL